MRMKTAPMYSICSTMQKENLFEITNNHLRKNFDSIDTVLVKTIQRIEDLRNKNEDFSGVPSGFSIAG